MSAKFPGGFITKNYVAPTPAAAPGIWTLDQQLQAQKTGTWPFGGPFNYIEDVFSTWLFTGTGANQTITNGINLSGKGGLVWTKCRSDVQNNSLVDTVRGGDVTLVSDTTAPNDYGSGQGAQSFTSTGYVTGGFSGRTYASWTFRKQPKFFDVVTYTGTGSVQNIAHNLGSVPGCIIVKNTNSSGYGWTTYHQSIGNTSYLSLNATDEAFVASNKWNNTTPTSTVFTVGSGADVNRSGYTYVAYIFAHNAGGFGLTGTDNVISCGSYTTGADAKATITLGYEPQWVLVKRATGVGEWYLLDNMRGWSMTQGNILQPNSSSAESADFGGVFYPTATGFVDDGTIAANSTMIYIAIRRGPMKVPTDGTKVFAPVTYTGTGAAQNIVGPSLPTDLFIGTKNQTASNRNFFDRLRGAGQYIRSDTTGSELTDTNTLSSFAVMNGVSLGTATMLNQSTVPYIGYFMRRAPGFFDEVCYTGNDADGRAVTHNLTSTPELMIVKSRSASAAPSWWVWNASTSGGLILNSADASSIYNWSPTDTPTSTTFKVSRGYGTNYISQTYVAYLFATCPGVSKVGSYTGTGATQTIACGFAAGARFVLIRRTDSTGDWYVWDTARGMVAGTDPKLALNTTAAESNANWVYTATTGFQIVTADASVNASGGTYIFLAIA